MRNHSPLFRREIEGNFSVRKCLLCVALKDRSKVNGFLEGTRSSSAGEREREKHDGFRFSDRYSSPDKRKEKKRYRWESFLPSLETNRSRLSSRRNMNNPLHNNNEHSKASRPIHNIFYQIFGCRSLLLVIAAV